jgi:hypothetical protein
MQEHQSQRDYRTDRDWHGGWAEEKRGSLMCFVLKLKPWNEHQETVQEKHYTYMDTGMHAKLLYMFRACDINVAKKQACTSASAGNSLAFCP